jgi:flagellin-like hook-associated protein FlgL
MYNSGNGYGLSSAQVAALTKAGLDLSTLALVRALVSASAASTTGSASAKLALVEKLYDLWSALSLAGLSALTIDSGVTSGFADITAQIVAACAATGDIGGAGGAAVINQERGFVVHTGVYADEHGNWTDDKELAEDLGLTEITYTVANNNYHWLTQSATFKSPDYLISANAGFIMTSATYEALSDAFAAATPYLANYSSASATARGSGVTSALCSADLMRNVASALAAKYPDLMPELHFTAGNVYGAKELTYQDIIDDAANPANTFTGGGPNGMVDSGKGLVVTTGVYVGANGNFTNESDVAAAFGMSEISIMVSANNYSTYRIRYRIGAGAWTVYNLTAPAKDLQSLAAEMSTIVRSMISNTQAGAPATIQPGQISTTQAMIPPLSVPAFNANRIFDPATPTPQPHDRNAANSPEWFLQVDITVAGTTSKVVLPPANPPLAPTANLNTIASTLTENLRQQLYQLQLAATTIPNGFNGVGKILRETAAPHSGPETEEEVEGLKAEDIWHEGSPAQTVTTQGIIDKTKRAFLVASAGTDYYNASGISNFGAWALASAINHNPSSQFWAMVQSHDSNGNKADMVYIFAKDGGDLNKLLACDVADGDVASRAALDAIEFENTETSTMNQSGTNLSLGGQYWGKFKPIQTRAGQGKEVWNLTIHGRDVGKERDLWIAAVSDGVNEIATPGLSGDIINGLDRYSFVEIQNAANGDWAGAEVRTQSSAQEALDALNSAMERKDKVRADLGALQNRLENTMTNLEIQVESLQASESRISDIDVATEMTEFVRNQVLAQAAVSMLSQANSLPQMALSLLNG